MTGIDSLNIIVTPGGIALDQRWLSSSAALAFQQSTWRLSGGLSADLRKHNNAWFGPDVSDLLNPVVPESGAYVARQSVSAAFVEVAHAFPLVTMTAGLRGTLVEGKRFMAPRLMLTAPLTSSIQLSLSANRRLQYDAIGSEPREGSITQPVFFLSTPRTADVVAISSAWRPRQAPGKARLQASATIYVRRLQNIPVMVADSAATSTEPTSTTAVFPQFQVTSGAVKGAAFAVDYATESGWLLQGSYTRQTGQDRRTGALRVNPWDAPHQLVGIVGIPFGGRFQVTVAQQLRSGTAITPIQYRLLTPTLFASNYVWRLIPGEPFSARRPNFLRTDIGVQGSWNALGRRWTASAQVVNLFYRTNGLDDTAGSLIACSAPGARCENGGATRRGLPVLPSVGLEIRW